MNKLRDGLIMAAVLLPVVFGLNYLFALAGHPSSLWAMQMLGLLP